MATQTEHHHGWKGGTRTIGSTDWPTTSFNTEAGPNTPGLSIRVHLAGHLGNYTGRRVDIEISEAVDVQSLLSQLCAMFPKVHDRILDEQEKMRPYVNVFVNEENIRDLQQGKTRVKNGDEVHILPSVAGGRPS